MYSTILVPIDGSSDTEGAVSRAIDFARTFGAAVHLLYVVDTGHELVGLDDEQRDQLRRQSEKRGRQATARVHERATELGLETTRAVCEGIPHRAILEYADDHDVDLIVMGTHGRTGAEHVGLGSTTERIITRTDIPVIAVPSSAEGGTANAIEYDHVVIGTDGSDIAERAAKRGLEIASLYGADVSVTYVIDTTTYELEDAPRSIIGLLKEGGENAVRTIAEEGRDRDLSVKTDIRRGVSHEELVEYVDEIEGDFIVMGSRGRGDVAGDLLGSTTARVLRRAKRPVLTVG